MPRFTTWSLVFLAVQAALSGSLGSACSDSGGSGTTGRRVTLKTVVIGEARAQTPFTNALGWTVTLRAAHASVGPFYYFDGEPIASRRAPAWRRVVGIKSAWAHPGHYVGGDARGEMIATASVDLLAASNVLPDGHGISGIVRSARFSFAAPGAAPYAEALRGRVVRVEGAASKGSSSLAFVAEADLADVLDGYGEPKVDGCAFARADVATDGTVMVTVRPTVWFDQVDFGSVPVDAAGAPTNLAGTEAFRGFTRGLKKGSAYVFSYATP